MTAHLPVNVAGIKPLAPSSATATATPLHTSESDGVRLELASSLSSSDMESTKRWLMRHGHGKQLHLMGSFLHELRVARMIPILQPSQSQQQPQTAQQQQQQQHPSDQQSSTSASALVENANANANDPRWALVHKTVNFLRHMIGSTSWKTAAEVLCLLRCLGRELQIATGPKEPAPGNMVRRIMAAIREEAVREAHEANIGLVLSNPTKSILPTTTPVPKPVPVPVPVDSSDGRISLQSMLWTLPQTHPLPASVSSSSPAPTPTPMFAHQLQHSASTTSSQHSFAMEEHHPQQGQEYPLSYYASRPNLKPAVMEAIQEIMTDFHDLHRNINEQAMNHIHAGEIILTCGNNVIVEHFIKAAACGKIDAGTGTLTTSKTKAKNPFTVIVCGSGSRGNDSSSSSSSIGVRDDTDNGYDMACRLCDMGIATTFVELSAVYTFMARVHKVVLPAHTVLANGGLVANSGCNLVALAAHAMSVPVVCVTGLYNLCPRFPHEGQGTLQDLVSPVPGIVADFGELAALDAVELVNPLHDYIEPKLVSLYITNVGTFQPSFIYRLLADNYHSNDWQTFQ